MEYNTPMEQTIGQKLKQIRESQGVSLEEISDETRIRMTYLRAIESNEVESLPSPLQMRGFLRLYASFLGVELESLQVEGYHLTDEAEEQDNASPSTPKELAPKKESQTSTPNEPPLDEEPPPITSQAEEASPPETQMSEEQEETLSPEITGEEFDSKAIFNQIGERLQQRRNLLSLSLDDIKSQLHIRTHYLIAIESGSFDDLPSSVQAKGMLANYADFLDLDVDTLLLDFAEGLQKQRLEKTKPSSDKNLPAKEVSTTVLKLRNFFSLDLLIITAIFIGFAAFVIWGVNRITTSRTPETETTSLPEVADILLATNSPTPQLTSSINAGGVTETEENLTPLAETPLFTPAENDSPINVVVVPLQQAWVRILSDSEVVFEGRLLPGNAYDYSGEEKVEILTGNAGALQLFFNDQDLGSLGLIGQVANLIITREGLILPTPTHTPTSTETPQVSPTPTLTPSPTPSPSETNDQEI